MSLLSDLEDLAALVKEASAPSAVEAATEAPATETIVSEQFELTGFMARTASSKEPES